MKFANSRHERLGLLPLMCAGKNHPLMDDVLGLWGFEFEFMVF